MVHKVQSVRNGWGPAALAGLMALAVALPPAARAATPAGYTVTLLHFAAAVGPDRSEPCDVVGEMFEPAGASSAHPVPAILTTNGFGGSYKDQAGLAGALARQGYAVLTYSGLGFGGSTCKITLDDPQFDGAAASRLVSYLGGAPGIAYLDQAHTVAAPTVDFVVHDAVDHLGRRERYDPRVGMVGGSYGGEVQFAAAAVDPRVDTIVPMITWNDLRYSLAPNDAAGPDPGPGVSKSTWAVLFSADGVGDGVTGAPSAPARVVGCPNFAAWVCPGLAFAGSAGYPAPSTLAHLMHASVADYIDRIRIPTLLVQGEDDTLFNLNEAVANYRALVARRVPVSMIWQSWGHSGSTPAPGELDLANPDPATQYETARLEAWFAHYLKGRPGSTGPGFAYFRDWVTYTGIATPAYATAPSYPVGSPRPLFLSAGARLVTAISAIRPSRSGFTTPGAGAPAGAAPPDAVGGAVPPVSVADTDAPGTYAAWSSAPLPGPVDVAGVPVLHVRLDAPTAAVTGRAGPAGDLVLFAKLFDVAPDGTRSLIHGLVAPVRVADPAAPLTVSLPGVVHRFGAGHRIELVLAGGDVNYRGGLVPTPVSVATGSADQVLDLPVVS